MAALTSLRSSRDFRRVYRTGRRVRADGVTVWAAPGDSEATRVGVAVPGSVGSAVTRNRLRRRLRAIVRDYPGRAGLEVVIAADRSAASLSYQELETHVAAALRAAGAGSDS